MVHTSFLMVAELSKWLHLPSRRLEHELGRAAVNIYRGTYVGFASHLDDPAEREEREDSNVRLKFR